MGSLDSRINHPIFIFVKECIKCMGIKSDFTYSSAPEPHRSRTKEILASHPEVRDLIGKNPYTVFAIIGLVAGIIALSWLVNDSSWWVVLLAAYCAGAFINHSLFVMIHECSHNLLFKKKSWNTCHAFCCFICTVPHKTSFIPGSVRA
jgi:fatty acid desaturase